jgi:hypothetical protein
MVTACNIFETVGNTEVAYIATQSNSGTWINPISEGSARDTFTETADVEARLM